MLRYVSLNHVTTLAWIFELSGGAIADFEDTCLPKEQREAVWTVAALHQWEMGVDDPRCITSAEEVSFICTCARVGCVMKVVCLYSGCRVP